MAHHCLVGKDFSRSVDVCCSPKGAAVTFLVFAPNGKQCATSTPSDGRGCPSVIVSQHGWRATGQVELAAHPPKLL